MRRITVRYRLLSGLRVGTQDIVCLPPARPRAGASFVIAVTMRPTDDRVEKSDYARALGVRLLELSEGQARLSLPSGRRTRTPPPGAPHGRCAASLGLIGGHVVSAVALGPKAGPFVTISSHVRYLSAALNADFVATTHLSRKGKEIYFADTSVETLDGKAISQISAVLRSCGASNGRSVPRRRATTVS